MTVKELKEKLKECNDSATVVIVHGEWKIKDIEIDNDNAIVKLR